MRLKVKSRKITRIFQDGYEVTKIFQDIKDDQSEEAQKYFNSKEYYNKCIQEMKEASKEIEDSQQ